MKNRLKIILLIIFILMSIIIIIVNFSKIKNDNSYKNSFYSKYINKIDEQDFSVDKITLGMTIQDVKNILGEPIENSEFIDSEDSGSSYKRFDYDNLIIQFDYEKEIVNYIASSRFGFKNNRGISAGDTVTEVLKNYYGEETIEVCENSYGSYEILYGKEDAIKYIEDLDSNNKTFGYIYKYNENINSILFCKNGKVIEFYLNNNIVNMIIIADRYKPW